MKAASAEISHQNCNLRPASVNVLTMKAASAEISHQNIKVLNMLQCLFKSIKECVAWFICEKCGVGNHIFISPVFEILHFRFPFHH